MTRGERFRELGAAPVTPLQADQERQREGVGGGGPEWRLPSGGRWLAGPTLTDEVMSKLRILIQTERFGQPRNLEQSQDLTRRSLQPYPALDQGRGSQ